MKRYVLLNPNAQWQDINSEYLSKDVTLVFCGTDKIPKRFSIPIDYIVINENAKYINGIEKEALHTNPSIKRINNYVDLQKYKQNSYLEIKDYCLLFDTKMLLRFKQENPQAQLIYRMNYPNDFLVTANSFYIRPEDLHYYENIFDIIVFSNAHLFNIYAKGFYPLDLNSLFLFQDDTPNIGNPMIAPSFARTRLTCKGLCWRGVPCSHCKRELSLAAALEEYYKNEFKKTN